MGQGSPTSTSFLLQAVQLAQLVSSPFFDLPVQAQLLAVGGLTDVALGAWLQLQYRRQLFTVRRLADVSLRARFLRLDAAVVFLLSALLETLLFRA